MKNRPILYFNLVSVKILVVLSGVMNYQTIAVNIGLPHLSMRQIIHILKDIVR